MPSLPVQLSASGRADARNREPADRGDLHTARMHRRNDPIGNTGPAGRPRAVLRLRPWPPTCSRWVPGQMDTLNTILGKAHQRDKNRNLDLLLLSIGANDIDFSGLVANVMIDHK